MNIPTYTSGILQVKAYRILQAHVSEKLNLFQLNSTEWSILGLIFENKNGIRHAEIAKILNVETPLVTMMVNGLEEKKLVERLNHPKDKRAKLLFLTPKGKNLIPEVESSLRETLSKILQGISPEELMTYRKVLETIVNNDLIKQKSEI